jgi:DNA repair exonuclease SbcCD ATPase subunit
MARDALDAILDGDLDLVDDDGNPIDPDDDRDDLPSVEEFRALQEKLEAVEKEKHGMLKTVQSERQKRQGVQQDLAELKGTVNTILQTRKQGASDLEPDVNLKAAVEYSDDGDGYVALDEALNPVVDKLTQEIKELKDYISQSEQTREADAQGNALIQSIVGEKPEYSSAYGRYQSYQSAHKWLDDRVTAWQNANGVQRPLTGGEALDYVFQDDKEFNEAFPGMNVERLNP